MKKTLLVLTALLFALASQVNAQKHCASDEVHQQHLHNNPAYAQRQAQIEQLTQRYIQNPNQRQSGNTIIIPCIVHVVYANAQENISDAQVVSQIDRLNLDFAGTNSDIGLTPSEFAVAGNTNIQFELIETIRYADSRATWGTNDDVKSSYPPIEPARILNMWVADIGGGILGYAQFPGDDPATDGVVMSPQYFGDKSAAGGSAFYLSSPFDLGRTATHEVGHWLNLRHIWGDGNCNVDDFVTDTPTQGASNGGCPTYPSKSCNSNGGFTSDMFMNYMDYVNDACMYMFSPGQNTRMQATFQNGGGREGFLLDPVYTPGGGGGGGGGACASTISAFPYGESFESGLGAWAQGSGDDLDWTNNSGGTPSNGTGPSAASDGSDYMYVEASSPNYPSKTTYLDGPCFDLTGQSGATFGFDYQMDGTDVGSLRLEAKPDGGSWTSVWTISGAQGTAWQSVSVDLGSYAGASVQLRFTGVTGAGWSSDIAVDNVSLTTGSAPTCDVVPSGLASSNVAQTTFTLTWNAVAGAASYDVDVNGTVLNATTNSLSLTGASASTTYTCSVRTNCASGSSPYSAAISVTTQDPVGGGGGNGCTGGIASFPYGESFESGLGDWSQGAGDDNDWTRDSGGTPSSGTGPSTGAAGSWYMFLETSGNGTGYPSKTAYLNGPCFDLGSESSASFGFEYHMNGTAVGSLDLQASDDDGITWTSIWSIAGSQGDAWNSASVDLASYTGGSVQVRFLATSGSGWSSDIAVDNISVSTTGGGGGGGGSTSSTVTLTLTTDNYGSETSWEVTDGSGNAVASGTGYGNNQTYTETITLADGCYDFTINDSYGDGICCSFGNGSYSLTEGSSTLASGASFTSSETTNFCVSSGSVRQIVSATAFEMNMYPNPASASTTIAVMLDRETDVNIQVFDMQGREVQATHMARVSGAVNAEINLKGMVSGIYLVAVTTTDGAKQTSKLVVK